MARDARSVGDRIEELLGGLRAGRDKQAAEELVRLLVELYGDGLARVVALVREHDPDLLGTLAADDLVAGLLVLHDLHPDDVDTRVNRALAKIRPYLGSHAGDVTFLGIDPGGVLRLRLEGSCHGCPSSTLTVRMAIEGAVHDAAPEITEVRVEGVAEPPAAPNRLLQIGMGPPAGWVAPDPEPAAEPAGSVWTTLAELGPPTGRAVSVPVEGTRVLVCAVRGTLYAYRDRCAGCGGTLSGSALSGAELTCAACGARFDVHLAGRGLDQPSQHLDPLPLLSDSQGVRVAVPARVGVS